MQFAEWMQQTRLISIIRGVDADKIEAVAEALYAGGVRLAEVTFDTTGARPDKEVAAMIAAASARMAGRMLIGAGTVMTPEQVELTKAAGGRFIISPNMDTEIIRKTKACGLVSIPAAMTVSEIVTADRAGADYIKVFPIDAIGGPRFFKAMRGPLPAVKLLAVSGIKAEEVPDYLAAGAFGFAVGSGIVNAGTANAGDFDTITANAKRYLAACAVSR